jgi:hypothetical protein
MQRLGLDDRALSAELHLTSAQVNRLRTDQWTTIKRSDLQTLLCWGKQHGEDLLRVEPSPIWRTLPGSEVRLFRGRDSSNNPLPADSRAEAELLEALTAIGCQIQPHSLSQPDESQVVESMKSTNCIFIGSPKYNTATEIALASLWRLTPFSTDKRDRDRIPFAFVWETPTSSSFSLTKNQHDRLGLYLYATGAKNERSRHHVAIDWRPPRDFAIWTGKGHDAGVFVVCNRPLGTDRDVTTIILAGHSGFATLDMTIDLARNGLRIESDAVRAGVPVVRVLSAVFRKNSRRGDSRKRASKGRRWIGPPWSQLKGMNTIRKK